VTDFLMNIETDRKELKIKSFVR